LPPTPLILFFLYYPHAPRALHSFPTRRSSDLAGDSRAPGLPRRRPVPRVQRQPRSRRCASFVSFSPPPSGPPPARAGRWWPTTRSEEHTSELQSRFDLVCRLLLEKKKKTKHKP